MATVSGDRELGSSQFPVEFPFRFMSCLVYCPCVAGPPAGPKAVPDVRKVTSTSTCYKTPTNKHETVPDVPCSCAGPRRPRKPDQLTPERHRGEDAFVPSLGDIEPNTASADRCV